MSRGLGDVYKRQDLDTERFFHPEGERGGTRRRRDEAAKAICAKCPVINQCREYALAAHEPYGVWGGLTQEERRTLIQEQRELTQRRTA